MLGLNDSQMVLFDYFQNFNSYPTASGVGLVSVSVVECTWLLALLSKLNTYLTPP
jgi:hypothetical protein